MSRIQIANVGLDNSNSNLSWPSWSFDGFSGYSGQMLQEEAWHFEPYENGLPEITNKQLLFDSGGSWAAFSGESKSETWIHQYTTVGGARKLESILKIDSQKNTIKLFCESTPIWNYPIDELFFLYTFSKNNSVLVHCCAYEYKNEGYIFCGVSGAGKSTLAEILKASHLPGDVLCDERNAVTFQQDQFWLSSTPWFGSGNICIPKTLPLKKIIVLDPSHKRAAISPLNTQQAIENFFKVVFLPQFFKQGISDSTNLIAQIVESVPMQKMSYDKNYDDVVSFLEAEVFSQ